MAVETPHFAFPFQLHQHGDRRELTKVEQDTEEHVMACVQVIVRCPLGFRIERPEYGVPWHDFRTEVIPAGVMQQQLREFEDRAKITTDVRRDWLDHADAYVTVYVESETGG